MRNGQNKVHVLFDGYSRMDADDPNAMRANCTCTLIETLNGRNIIVDTMTAWDGDRLINALKVYALNPSDIDVVVCTHGHADHIGCNFLFPNAQWHIVGTCVSNRDKFLDWSFTDSPFEIDGPDVIVVPTTGHTMSCVSVLVRNSNLGDIVGICGDLFERMEDISDPSIWLSAGSENPELQRKNRLSISEQCTYIVPGHGPGFQVTEYMRGQLRDDISKH